MSVFPKMLEFKQKEIPSAQLLMSQQWFSIYNYKIKHIKGKDNVVADILSRPQPTTKSKEIHFVLMMMGESSRVRLDSTENPNFPLDIDTDQYPWTHEYLFERRSDWEVRLFRYHGGGMFQPIGISPKYPFAQVSLSDLMIGQKKSLGYFGIFAKNITF